MRRLRRVILDFFDEHDWWWWKSSAATEEVKGIIGYENAQAGIRYTPINQVECARVENRIGYKNVQS